MLTIITATLNAGAFLDRALASAAAQTGPVQHIVVDGGSSDETVAICRRHPAIDLIEVPGCSLYEAWNLGLARARSDAIMFLNADDELMLDAAKRVAAAFAADPDTDIFAGSAAFIDVDRPDANLPVLAAAPKGMLDVAQLAAGVPVINALAFRPRVFTRHGGFDTVYRVAGDRAFLLRLALLPEPPRVVATDAVLYRYYIHAGSLTLRSGLVARLRIARDHIALARTLLARDIEPSTALWLRHMKRRERVVALLRCLAARRWTEAWRFVRL